MHNGGGDDEHWRKPKRGLIASLINRKDSQGSKDSFQGDEIENEASPSNGPLRPQTVH